MPDYAPPPPLYQSHRVNTSVGRPSGRPSLLRLVSPRASAASYSFCSPCIRVPYGTSTLWSRPADRTRAPWVRPYVSEVDIARESAILILSVEESHLIPNRKFIVPCRRVLLFATLMMLFCRMLVFAVLSLKYYTDFVFFLTCAVPGGAAGSYGRAEPIRCRPRDGERLRRGEGVSRDRFGGEIDDLSSPLRRFRRCRALPILFFLFFRSSCILQVTCLGFWSP